MCINGEGRRWKGIMSKSIQPFHKPNYSIVLEKANMENDDQEIDPELWLYALLAMTGDKNQKQALVEKISRNTGFPPEKVEIILEALLKTLMEKVRSN